MSPDTFRRGDYVRIPPSSLRRPFDEGFVIGVSCTRKLWVWCVVGKDRWPALIAAGDVLFRAIDRECPVRLPKWGGRVTL